MTARVGNYFADTITLASSGSGGYTSSAYTKGEVYVIKEMVSVAAADADGDTYTIGVIPSSAIVLRGASNLSTTAITAGTDYDIGLYDINQTATNWVGTVVDKDIFLDGQDLSSASLALDPVATVSAANSGKPVWSLLGLTADPEKNYLVVLTANTVGSAAGSVQIELAYCM